MSNGHGLRRLVNPRGANHAPRAGALPRRKGPLSAWARPFSGAENAMISPGTTTLVPKCSRCAGALMGRNAVARTNAWSFVAAFIVLGGKLTYFGHRDKVKGPFVAGATPPLS